MAFYFSHRVGNADERYISNMRELDETDNYGIHVDRRSRYLARTVEHGFAFMKFGYTDNPDVAERERVKFVTDTYEDEEGEYAFTPATEIKKLHGRKAMANAGLKLDIEAWENARRGVMKNLLLLRAQEDAQFVKILIVGLVDRGGMFLHFDRSGANSYWGGSFQKTRDRRMLAAKKDHKLITEELYREFWRGKNVLGDLMGEVAVMIMDDDY